MADRGIYQSEMRTSINQVAPQEPAPNGTPELDTLMKVGQQIIEHGQQAKINENFSQAQVDVNNLDRQFQVDYGHDPFNKEGLQKLKEDKNAVFAKNADGISPFFKQPYDDATRKLGQTSAAAIEAYGYTQTKKNTVTSMNNALKNNLSQAAIDGENGVPLGQVMLNFSTSKQALVQTADGILSEPESTELLENFNQDYLKMYLSGKGQDSPLDALKLMDSEEVKGSFRDREEYNKMRDAFETKALKIQDFNIQKEVINTLKNESDLFQQDRPLSYAEMQTATQGMSGPSKKYFMKASGFAAEGKKKKLDDTQKVELKASIVDDISAITKQDNIDLNSISNLQAKVFDAMNKDALTQKEGLGLIMQLVKPTLAGREERISNFSSGKWNPFKEDVGFPVIEDFYNNHVLIQPGEDQKKVGPTSAALNATNKANLYDYYFQALTSEASKRGVAVGELEKIEDSKIRRDIYKRASDAAINEFRSNKSPLSLRSGIPQRAIEYLIQNPNLNKQFDEQYGTGASNRILGR